MTNLGTHVSLCCYGRLKLYHWCKFCMNHEWDCMMSRYNYYFYTIPRAVTTWMPLFRNFFGFISSSWLAFFIWCIMGSVYFMFYNNVDVVIMRWLVLIFCVVSTIYPALETPEFFISVWVLFLSGMLAETWLPLSSQIPIPFSPLKTHHSYGGDGHCEDYKGLDWNSPISGISLCHHDVPTHSFYSYTTSTRIHFACPFD